MTAPNHARPLGRRAAMRAVALGALATTLAACSSSPAAPGTSAGTASSTGEIETSNTRSSGSAGASAASNSRPGASRSGSDASGSGSSPSAASPGTAPPTGATSATPPAEITGVTVTGTIATGLHVPWGLGFLPDGTALVTERQTARLLAISPGPDHAVRTIGTIDGVVAAGEGGLLGLVVSPSAGSPAAGSAATESAGPTVFVYYTARADNRVAAVTLDSGATRITGQRDLISGIPKATVHDGGRLAIGPDGLIYIGTGDATQPDKAQHLDYLGGKILRIAQDGKPAAGNPFADAPLVYSYGHRNVQGLAFDERNRLWASEFGANAYDELNLVRAGGNYGWPVVEGPSSDSRFVAPYKYWPTSQASPSGLAIVDGTAFMAALRGTRLWMIPLSGGAGATEPVPLLEDRYGRLRTVVLAPDGNLWLTTSNTDGRGSPQPGDDRILQLTLR